MSYGRHVARGVWKMIEYYTTNSQICTGDRAKFVLCQVILKGALIIDLLSRSCLNDRSANDSV